ncbi:MAG: hypothetical protein WEF50_04635 [Myxococcota bacterium]
MKKRVSQKRARRATPKRVRPPRDPSGAPLWWSEEDGRWLTDAECEALVRESIESVGPVDGERRRQRAKKLREQSEREQP